MCATRELRPPDPATVKDPAKSTAPTQSIPKSVTQFQQENPDVAQCPAPATAPSTLEGRNKVAAELRSLFEDGDLSNRIPTPEDIEKLIVKMSSEAILSIDEVWMRDHSSAHVKEKDKIIDKIYRDWIEGKLKMSEMQVRRSEENARKMSISKEIKADKTRKVRKKQAKRRREERLTKIEDILEIPVQLPIGTNASLGTLQPTSLMIHSKHSEAKEVKVSLDMLDLMACLILRALRDRTLEARIVKRKEGLGVNDKAEKQNSGGKEKMPMLSVPRDKENSKEALRVRESCSAIAQCVEEQKHGKDKKDAMMAAAAELNPIIKKQVTESKLTQTMPSWENSNLKKIWDAKIPEEIEEFLVSAIAQKGLASNATPSQVPSEKLSQGTNPKPLEQRLQHTINEHERLLADIRAIIREYHVAGLGIKPDATANLASEWPLPVLKAVQEAKSKALRDRMRDSRKSSQQAKKPPSKEEIKAKNAAKEELIRRMIKITRNMLPYFLTISFDVKGLSDRLMESIETLSHDLHDNWRQHA